MTEDWLLRAEMICLQCGGHCCHDAHPPITGSCHQRLLGEGIPPGCFETEGYHRLKVHPDSTCILMEEGKCSIHGVKPETCRAGPFTFDVRDDVIEIFLKYERICPVVGLLKIVPAAYRQQYSLAVQQISALVAALPEDELAAICRIEEPDTEKVAEIPRPRGSP